MKSIETKWIGTDQCRHRESWPQYCDWLEIYRHGELVAIVDEDLGEIRLPHNPGGWYDRTYKGQCIPVKILHIAYSYVKVEIQNACKTVWKAYYYPRPVREASNE